MVDGNIDPRSVEAMEKFKKYSKEATQNMKGLQQQMDKFSNSMAMTKSHTIDLREALRGVGDSKPFGQTNDISNEVKAGVSNNNQTNDITINLRIDVSGVTDRTDKRALAKEISAMVTKELRTKIGGPLVNSGFSRSG